MAKRVSSPTMSRRLSEQSRQGEAAPLRQFLDKLAEAADALGAHGEMPFSLGGKEGRAVFGYTIRSGLDGLKAERFGDAAPTPRGPAARAPIVDVFEEGDIIRIVAELPGADAETVTCTLRGDQLDIRSDGAQLYARTVALPASVDAASLAQSCRNGILEVRLRRADRP